MAWTRLVFSRVFEGEALWRVVREVLLDGDMIKWICVGLVEAKRMECMWVVWFISRVWG
jgi:hypothetical protein